MKDFRYAACSLGTGVMGSTSSAALAAAGLSVALWGRSGESVARGLASAAKALSALGENGLLDCTEKEALSRIIPVQDFAEAAASSYFILESVPENLPAKHSVLLEAEKYCREDAILASNTSGLLPSDIAAPLERPDRFLVTHFWNPAHLMPLVEVCPGRKTSQETTTRAKEFLLSAGKKPVVLAKEAHGFIVNRLQFALLREAVHIVESGIASMEEVDEATKASLGRRLADTGPFETADLGGLDVFSSITAYLFADLSAASGTPAILADRVKRGLLGAKTGEGLYAWTEEKRRRFEEARTGTLIRLLKRDREA